MTCTINASVSSSGIVSTADGSGVLKIQSDGKTTNALAWVNFDGTLTSPITPRANYNMSSITKSGTGDYICNFTSALSDANYSVSGTALATVNSSTYTGVTIKYTTTFSTTAFSITVKNDAGASVDSSIVCVQVHGN